MYTKSKRMTYKCLIIFIVTILNIGFVNVCAQNSNSGSAIPIPDFIYEMRVEDAWKDKDFKKAQSLLEDGLKSYPGNAKLWDYQAGVALRQKKYVKAIEAGNHALKLSPTSTRHANLGRIYHLSKQHKKAIKHYKLGPKQGSKWGPLYFYLADCLERTGQKDEAIKYYKQYFHTATVGSRSKEAEKRVALLQEPGVSGGFGMTATQKRQQDAICNKKYPGRIVVNFDPFTKEVECGCPDGGIDIGEGCLCKLELEIIRAVNKRDIDQAERLAAQADQQSCKFYSKVLQHVKLLVKIKRETPWMLDDESFKKEMKRRDRAFNEKMARLDRDFNKAMKEHDEQTRKDDELWAQMSKNILENQMKMINGIIVSTNTPAPGELGPGVQPQSYITFDDDEEEEEEMGDRIVLLGEPVTDELDPDFGKGHKINAPRRINPDKIVGIWEGKGGYGIECPAPRGYIGEMTSWIVRLEIRAKNNGFVGRVLGPSKFEACPEVIVHCPIGCRPNDICFQVHLDPDYVPATLWNSGNSYGVPFIGEIWKWKCPRDGKMSGPEKKNCTIHLLGNDSLSIGILGTYLKRVGN